MLLAGRLFFAFMIIKLEKVIRVILQLSCVYIQDLRMPLSQKTKICDTFFSDFELVTCNKYVK